MYFPACVGTRIARATPITSAMRVAAMQGNAAKAMLIFMIAKLLVRSHAYAQDSSGLELSWDVRPPGPVAPG